MVSEARVLLCMYLTISEVMGSGARARNKTHFKSLSHTSQRDFFYIFSPNNPYQAMYKLCSGAKSSTPAPPTHPGGPMIENTPAHPLMNKKLQNHSNPSHFPSEFGPPWVGSSKNGGETANQGGKVKKKLMIHIRPLF